MTFTNAAFPIHPDYFEAVRVHNAALARLAHDCTSCAADYLAADTAFSDALKALPDERRKRGPAHYQLEDEMPRTRESVRRAN